MRRPMLQGPGTCFFIPLGIFNAYLKNSEKMGS
jgi:hypothetical protein